MAGELLGRGKGKNHSKKKSIIAEETQVTDLGRAVLRQTLRCTRERKLCSGGQFRARD